MDAGRLTFCEDGGLAGLEGGVGDGEDELEAWFEDWGGHFRWSCLSYYYIHLDLYFR